MVADALGIPFYAIDVSAPFARLIDGFVDAYRSGRTPNPCVACNVDVKFGRLLEVARSIGADRVATGHYARVRLERGRHVLSRAADRAKDQSYVLSLLAQEQLAHAVFPLGGLTKAEARAAARRAGLVVADKPESQEICFVPSGDYRDLLEQRGMPDLPGELVTAEGEVVGAHEGVASFTVGQRKGLGVALGAPRHVVRIEPDTRRVVIGRRDQACASAFTLRGANWILEAEPAPGARRRGTARIRHRHDPMPAEATVTAPGEVRVTFDAPEFAVTPGQTAAVYAGDGVLVAGTIHEVGVGST
jgi:tRNA-specific 2-thiouridylase